MKIFYSKIFIDKFLLVHDNFLLYVANIDTAEMDWYSKRKKRDIIIEQ